MSADFSKAKDAAEAALAKARDRATEGADELHREADRAAYRLEQRAGQAIDSASEAAEQASERARTIAQNFRGNIRDAGDRAAETLGHARDALAETGERIAETLRGTAEQVDLKKMQDSVVNAVSSGVSATATALRERDVAGLAEDLRAAARRHPGTFVLGAAAVGFIVGRFLLASRDEADRRRGGRY